MAEFRILKFGVVRLAFSLGGHVFALLEAHRIEEGFVLRRRRGDAIIPKSLIVVAIDWLYDIGLGVELRPHLAKIVAEKPTDRPADRRVAPVAGGGREQATAFRHPCIVVDVVRIDQRTRKPRHQRRRGDGAGRGRDVKRQPQAAKARKATHRQFLDPGILDE